jgi:hypothetical protein
MWVSRRSLPPRRLQRGQILLITFCLIPQCDRSVDLCEPHALWTIMLIADNGIWYQARLSIS